MRPRKPRNQKITSGTLRRDRDRPDPAPREGSPPKPPPYLSAKAKRVFRDYVAWCPWLVEADGRPLAIYVDLLLIAELGAHKLTAAQLSQMRGLSGDLGFRAATTAAARQYRDAPPPPDEPTDPEEAARRERAREFFD